MPNFMVRFQSSKTRNIVIIVGVIILGVLLFGLYLSTGDEAEEKVSRTKLPKPPKGIEFVPGAKGVSKEYLKTLIRSEKIAAEEALKRGESAVPTIIRAGGRIEEAGRALSETEETCYSQCLACCRGEKSTSSLLNEWVKKGDVSAEVAAEISKMQDKGVSIDEYAANLDRLVREGKITPEQAKQLLDVYRREKEVVKKPEKPEKEAVPPPVKEEIPSSDDLLNQMVGTGAMSPAVATELRQLQRSGKSVNDYAADLNRLVKEGKITPEQAKQLLAAYKKEKVLAPLPDYDEVVERLMGEGKVPADVADRLNDLRSAKVSAAEYAQELNALVKSGRLSPETAQKLLAAYRKTYGTTAVTVTDPGLRRLQQVQQRQELRLQEQALREKQMLAEKRRRKTVDKSAALEEENKRKQALQGAIGSQVQALLGAWNVTPQVFTGGKAKEEDKAVKEGDRVENGGGVSDGRGERKSALKKATIVKAGDIMFAVLDTSVNSDQPGPVMATLVSGPFKDGRLLGSLTVTPDKKRVMLKFNVLSVSGAPESITINAVAINPDTARTAIATDVDSHYLLRYGSLFASNFIAGYAEAVKTSGTTTTTDGTTGDETKEAPEYTPKEKLTIGLGEVGKKLSEVWGGLFDTPPTVKVESGVGLGILFLKDVKG